MKLGNRVAPSRFLLFLLISIVSGALACPWMGWRNGFLIGFDVGSALFLVSLVPLLRASSVAEMRVHAAENDANRAVLLAITATVMLVILGSVALELAKQGGPNTWTITLVVVTLALSWLFTNSIFALHYAHMFYQGSGERAGDCGGIEFPGTPKPDYLDFLYFAFCLGMTFQTSDTNIQVTRIRRVATLHAMLGFVFSIGVIAFTINVLGGVGGAGTVPAAVR